MIAETLQITPGGITIIRSTNYLLPVMNRDLLPVISQDFLPAITDQ